MEEEPGLYNNSFTVTEAITATDIAYQMWHNFTNECGEHVLPLFPTTTTGFVVTLTVTPIIPEEI